MPTPIEKREIRATVNVGKIAKHSEPAKASRKAPISTGFSRNFSTSRPDGIDVL